MIPSLNPALLNGIGYVCNGGYLFVKLRFAYQSKPDSKMQ